jgi:hypothetical protein
VNNPASSSIGLVEVDLAVLVTDQYLDVAIAEREAIDSAIRLPDALRIELEQGERGAVHAGIGQRFGLGVLQQVARKPRLGPAGRHEARRQDRQQARDPEHRHQGDAAGRAEHLARHRLTQP